MRATIDCSTRTLRGQSAKTTLYLIATAHLDSQWNWTVQDTIRDHVPKTFHTNFAFFEKYPDLAKYELIVDAVSTKLQQKGFTAGSRAADHRSFDHLRVIWRPVFGHVKATPACR